MIISGNMVNLQLLKVSRKCVCNDRKEVRNILALKDSERNYNN